MDKVQNDSAFSIQAYNLKPNEQQNVYIDSCWFETPYVALNESNNVSLRFILQTTTRDFPQQDNSNFITNHDMPRVMNQLGENKEGKAKVAAGILLTAPGIPFIYYGEEIGMSGTKPDEPHSA